MINIKVITKIVLTIGLLAIFSSCQIGQYHTAKTLKKGEKQLLVGVDSYLSYSPLVIPFSPTLHFNWGTDKKRDHTLELSASMQMSYAIKYQLYDKAKWSIAFRPRVGYGINSKFSSDGQQFFAKTPFIFTKEFGKKSSVTISPGVLFSFPGWNGKLKYRASLPNAHPIFQRAMIFTSFTYHRGNKNRFYTSLSFLNAITEGKSIVGQVSVGYIFKWSRVKKQ